MRAKYGFKMVFLNFYSQMLTEGLKELENKTLHLFVHKNTSLTIKEIKSFYKAMFVYHGRNQTNTYYLMLVI